MLTVRQVQRVTPHLIRVTLGGEKLQGFASPGFDDHVKLIFPDPATGQLALPSFGAPGEAPAPDAPKPVMRDYTPRRHDAAAQTLEIDFALHEAGPATQWAEQAAPGQQLGVGGPRGSFIIPTGFDGHLLIGDDTALPAIARRLAELPAGARAVVLAEVDSAADELAFDSAAAVSLTWVHRRGAEPGTTDGLLQALKTLPLPAGDFHAWVACESAVAKALRAYLIAERGAHPRWTKAAGYWRRGSAATHDTHED
ncbi:siderophore-interacting protein [Variovorax sp. CYS-02]|uniref:Siderophore-interacting protein n=2 Tax=Variovorax terrae TaxID=2923278 RepID=A0A9X2ASU8_9BURK|nr:siderophore-interacting protein [Variovorax terrae]MCJ0765741.1 siderophore-interacting protein [Variovorax terrae]